MEIICEQSQKDEEMYLQKFAFCGSTEVFKNNISSLAAMAEPEKWSFDGNANSLLIKYINAIFKQCYKQDRIMYTDDKSYACFNTGLLTPNGNDIISVFKKNFKDYDQPWFHLYFCDKADRKFMDLFSDVPQLATFTENYEELYFNPNYNITLNSDHILDDNWERIESVVKLSKPLMKTLMFGVLEEAKRKIHRNLRLVVPQYYKNQIMYLVPIRIPVDNDESVIMALAVELTQTKQYRANTILTKEMAYEKARILMKPESNWLI